MEDERISQKTNNNRVEVIPSFSFNIAWCTNIINRLANVITIHSHDTKDTSVSLTCAPPERGK